MKKCPYCNSKDHYFKEQSPLNYTVQGCVRFMLETIKEVYMTPKKDEFKNTLDRLAMGDPEVKLDGLFETVEDDNATT